MKTAALLILPILMNRLEEAVTSKNLILVIIKTLQDKSVRRTTNNRMYPHEETHHLEKQTLKHLARVNEITAFIENNVMMTKYLYSEMNRIKVKGNTLDMGRQMIVHFEAEHGKAQKTLVLRNFIVFCYELLTSKKVQPKGFWGAHKTNNLVIHNIQELYNNQAS